MFNFIWRRLTQWQSHKAPIKCRPERTRLAVEMLESRITPTVTATISGSTLTLTTSVADNLSIANVGFQEFTVTDLAGNTFNSSGLSTYTTATPVTAMVINLGAAATTLTFAGTAAAPIDLSGPTTTNTLHQLLQTTAGPDLTITGSGNKTIAATDLFLLHTKASLSMTLSNGTENTTFTDSNIAGSATINHTGSGDTSFSIATSAANPAGFNTWGSLSITNAIGSDINSITDTDFIGNVTISNGAGSNVAGESTGQFGGSENIFSAINNKNLLTIGGNLNIGTTNGQSDTEVNDYNVHGTLTITGGAGIANQTFPNVVGVNDNQTNNPTNPGAGTVIPGIPTFGSISITSGSAVNVGLTVNVGINAAGTVDYPLMVATTLSVDATGLTTALPTGDTNPATIILNDLTVGGTATVTTSATTANDAIAVQGDAAVSTYGALTINSSAIGANAVDLQTEIGTLKVIGALGVNFGAGNDTLTVGVAGTPASVGPPPVAAVPPGTVTAGGSFGVTGTGGAKVIDVVGATFGGMNWALKDTTSTEPTSGTAAETALFTDTNVAGTASISNTALIGSTSFTIQISKNNPSLLNTWGSLSITNGTGSDINNITDTNFTGSVTIINGAGSNVTGSGPGQSTGLYGGSHTTLSDDTNGYNGHLLNIAGSLTITTTTGQSDTEVQDYNVGGSVTLGAGAGITNQQNPSIIGLENGQTVTQPPAGSTGAPATTAGIPIIGGSVTLTGDPVTGANTSVEAVIGTAITVGGDFPLTVGNGVNANFTGAGVSDITLNDLYVTGSSNLSLASTGGNTLFINEGNGVPTSFGPLTISAKAAVNNTDLVNLQQSEAGTLNVVGGLTVNFGLGTDTLDLGSATSNVSVTGTFSVTGTTGTGGSEAITAQNDSFGAVSFSLAGTENTAALNAETPAVTTTFADTSVTGAATFSHTGVGNTSFVIKTIANSLNSWGSLAITNGTGTDANSISDTDFGGNVTIANGAGITGAASTGLNAGSQTLFAAVRNTNLLTIHGNLSITTTTDQSDTEVNDYNIHGTVTLGAGAGVANQSNASIIGLNDNQLATVLGIPVIGGAVTITGNPVPGPVGSPLAIGLIINLGANAAHTKNYPLILQAGLSITTAGTGAADIDLNDLSVASGATTITLGISNSNDLVQVQGSSANPAFTSVYDAFTITSSATVANTFDIQDQAGTLEFTGTVNVVLGSGADTLNLGPVGGAHPSVIDFWGLSTFNGGLGTNVFNVGTAGTNLFFINTPTYINP